MAKPQKITPFLWFDDKAEQAAQLYTSIFKKSSIDKVMPVPSGTSTVVSFTLNGQQFSALNGGPWFKLNPSISLFVSTKSLAETKRVWKALSKGGEVMMPLQEYPWSKQYGWCRDQFGASWQVMMGGFTSTKKQFVPSFLFTGPQKGRAGEAIEFWTGVFPKSSVAMLDHYKKGEPGPEGWLKYGEFTLAGQTLSAMDNPQPQADFTFNEAFSFLINCKNQKEVDFYWEKLTADGGSEGNCGWCKDKFGVSWQVVPEAFLKMVSSPDPSVAQTAMAAVMRMGKINIRKLSKMPPPLKPITVKAKIGAPVEKVWRLWTEPQHIMKWNNASDDWHTPAATNDLRTGGSFSATMAAKDGSMSFEFGGTYTEVAENQLIAYVMGDGRKARVTFKSSGGKTEVVETFDPETMNPREMQQAGWQAILDNFKRYAERG